MVSVVFIAWMARRSRSRCAGVLGASGAISGGAQRACRSACVAVSATGSGRLALRGRDWRGASSACQKLVKVGSASASARRRAASTIRRARSRARAAGDVGASITPENTSENRLGQSSGWSSDCRAVTVRAARRSGGRRGTTRACGSRGRKGRVWLDIMKTPGTGKSGDWSNTWQVLARAVAESGANCGGKRAIAKAAETL